MGGGGGGKKGQGCIKWGPQEFFPKIVNKKSLKSKLSWIFTTSLTPYP